MRPTIGTVYACICRTTAEANLALTMEAERDGTTIGPIEPILDDTESYIVGGMAKVTGYARRN